jgi:hypothetical protein
MAEQDADKSFELGTVGFELGNRVVGNSIVQHKDLRALKSALLIAEVPYGAVTSGRKPCTPISRRCAHLWGF